MLADRGQASASQNLNLAYSKHSPTYKMLTKEWSGSRNLKSVTCWYGIEYGILSSTRLAKGAITLSVWALFGALDCGGASGVLRGDKNDTLVWKKPKVRVCMHAAVL